MEWGSSKASHGPKSPGRKTAMTPKAAKHFVKRELHSAAKATVARTKAGGAKPRSNAVSKLTSDMWKKAKG